MAELEPVEKRLRAAADKALAAYDRPTMVGKETAGVECFLLEMSRAPDTRYLYFFYSRAFQTLRREADRGRQAFETAMLAILELCPRPAGWVPDR